MSENAALTSDGIPALCNTTGQAHASTRTPEPLTWIHLT
jgi:hypothetical protein